jgi:hypothetical protein
MPEQSWCFMQVVGMAQQSSRISASLAEAMAPVEYGFYFVILYNVLGPVLGLILMGGIGGGFLLVPVLALCIIALGPLVLTVVQTAWIPLVCGLSYLFIQLVLHGESMYAMYVYQFGPWLFSLVVVQCLVMYRPNFLHRFAWFTLFIGLSMLPLLSLEHGGQYDRIGLDRGVGYANPNALGGWFGFCVLYLTIKGYLETRPMYRFGIWLLAVGSIYVVTLTVSRGALLAVAVCLLIAFKRLWKEGLVPLLLLACLMAVLLEFGVFDKAIHSYSARGTEETGRLQVWPLLIERFLNSPLIGNGASNVGAVVSTGSLITPHNGFLLIAVASGVVPLLLFVAYCWRSGMAALHAKDRNQDSLFYLPLSIYAVLIICAGNMDFMTPWAVVSLAAPTAAIFHQTERIRI